MPKTSASIQRRDTPLTVGYIPASTASTIPAAPTVAMLSICNPDSPVPLDGGFGALMRLEFSDVDDRAVPAWRDRLADLAHRMKRPDWEPRLLSRKNGGWPVVPFSRADAVAVIRFVQTLSVDIRVLLIHCEYGKSRSRAVAEFVVENGPAFGGATLAEVRPHVDASVGANARVARLLREELARITCGTPFRVV